MLKSGGNTGCVCAAKPLQVIWQNMSMADLCKNELQLKQAMQIQQTATSQLHTAMPMLHVQIELHLRFSTRFLKCENTLGVAAYPQSPFSAAFHFLVLPDQAMLLFLPIPGLVANGLHVLLILAADALYLFRHWHNHLKSCCCFVRFKVCPHLDENDSLQCHATALRHTT